MPSLITRLLFATDFSECSRRAEEWASFLAAAFQAELEVLHVIELYPGLDPSYPVNTVYLDAQRKETERHVNDAVQRLSGHAFKVTGRHAIGVPSAQTSAIARESNTDLIAVGTHGRGGLEHVLLGSTAERVVTTAPCPVLTVRCPRTSPAETTGALDLRRFLVPIDFSDCSLDALEYAVQLAEPFQAALTIVHVLEPVAYGLDFTLVQPPDRTRISKGLSRIADAAQASGLRVDTAITGGLPSETIVDLASGGFDIVVMGTHGRRGLSHAVKGSVVEAVLRRSPCPVLAVKSPKFAPGHTRVITKAGGIPSQA